MRTTLQQVKSRLAVTACWILVLVIPLLASFAVAADVSAKHGWSAEGLRAAREYSETLDTAAVVILHNGATVDEWGATALPLMCHSVRKSLLSALYGRHVKNGTIDLNRTLKQLGINDNEPSLTEAELGAQIRHLLMARSGVYHPALYETAAMAKARPARGSHAPDTFWYYNNWDFNAAAAIFENLTGQGQRALWAI
ncbi:serine hydrolase [Fuerstiella marisgermanici]|uniref:Beta-lactamase n=1 Tax=Fuerstiella marisgermanici TaxID=1891926 RepID=A0A1P8WFR9_9PLAN|nr:serine hydrolase [Fuerstiella marisgermanici]APZ92909.1 Beta-lactamase [Fuerstiella marisgermanici]